MFSDVYVFFVLTFAISMTSLQPRSQEKSGRNSGNRETNNESSAKGKIKSASLCSGVGNCTCLVEKLNVTVMCSSNGHHNLHEIAAELPQTTTHL